MNRELSNIEKAMLIVGIFTVTLGEIFHYRIFDGTIVGTVVMLFGMALLGGFGVWQLAAATYDVISLSRHGEEATAIIKTVKRRQKYAYYMLSYTTGNNRRHSLKLESPMIWKAPGIGDKIKIKYDPKKFKRYIAVPSDYHKLIVYYVFFLMMAALVVSVVVFRGV